MVSFLFADLIVLPILNIYRKYYGLGISTLLLGVFYISMAAAALAVEGLFDIFHLIPQERHLLVMEESIRWNSTTVLNILFLTLASVLVIRFFRTRGLQMMRMMSSPHDQTMSHEHQDHHH